MSIFMKNSNNNNNKTYFRNCQTFFFIKKFDSFKKTWLLTPIACLYA